MGKTELYMKLDTIKLALESSATLLGQMAIYELEGKQVQNISADNVKLINVTIYTAEKMLRDVMLNELEIKEDDKEETDQL